MLQASSTRETRDSAREVKFLVPADRAALVLDWARSRLTPDPYANGDDGDDYRTTTIYFDTPDQAVYHRHGSFGRSKYRVRRYGTSDIAFIERKLRTGALLSKRRTACPLTEIEQMLASADTGSWAGRWFAERVALRRLAPVCQLSYRRHARVAMGAYGPMRLTLDDELSAQRTESFHFAPGAGTRFLTGQVIIEMKYCVETPAIFRHLVQDFALSPARISKYRLAIGALAEQPALEPQVGIAPALGATDLTGFANA